MPHATNSGYHEERLGEERSLSAGTSSLTSGDKPEKSGDRPQDTESSLPLPARAAESHSGQAQSRTRSRSTASSTGGSTHETTSAQVSHPASSEESTMTSPKRKGTAK